MIHDSKSQQLSELAAGKGVLLNCNLGLGVEVTELPDGRASIHVSPTPITNGYDGPALRAFMEETAVKWLEVVAPHRLNIGSGY